MNNIILFTESDTEEQVTRLLNLKKVTDELLVLTGRIVDIDITVFNINKFDLYIDKVKDNNTCIIITVSDPKAWCEMNGFKRVSDKINVDGQECFVFFDYKTCAKKDKSAKAKSNTYKLAYPVKLINHIRDTFKLRLTDLFSLKEPYYYNAIPKGFSTSIAKEVTITNLYLLLERMRESYDMLVAFDTEFYNVTQKLQVDGVFDYVSDDNEDDTDLEYSTKTLVNTHLDDVYLRTLTFATRCFTTQRIEVYECVIEQHDDSYALDFEFQKQLKELLCLLFIKRECNGYVRFFAHNATVDVPIISKFIDVVKFDCEDTLVMYHLINTHENKGLKDISAKLFPLFTDYDMSVSTTNENELERLLIQKSADKLRVAYNKFGVKAINSKWATADLEMLLRYNSIDSFLTLRLAIYCIAELRINSRLTKCYYGLFKPQVNLLLGVERAGIPLQPDVANEYSNKIEEYLTSKSFIQYQTGIFKARIWKLKIQVVTSLCKLLKDYNKAYKTDYEIRFVSATKNATELHEIPTHEIIKQITVIQDDIGSRFTDTSLKANTSKKLHEYIRLFQNEIGKLQILISAHKEWQFDSNNKVIQPSEERCREVYAKYDNVVPLFNIQAPKDNSILINMVCMLHKLEPENTFKVDVVPYADAVSFVLSRYKDSDNYTKSVLYDALKHISNMKRVVKVRATYLVSMLNSYKFNDRYNCYTYHSSFRQVTNTSRLSSGGEGKSNTQNLSDSNRLPKYAEEVKPYVAAIKKSIGFNSGDFKIEFGQTFSDVASKYGDMPLLVEIDYSQIELYHAARLATISLMLQYIRESKDLHSLSAAIGNDMSYEEYLLWKDKGVTRHIAKTVNFTLTYGGSPFSAKNYAESTFGVTKPIEHWDNLYNSFHAAYPEVIPYMRKAFCNFIDSGIVTTYTGFTRQLAKEQGFSSIYPELKKMFVADGIKQTDDIVEWIRRNRRLSWEDKRVINSVYKQCFNVEVQGGANSYTMCANIINNAYMQKRDVGFDNAITSRYQSDYKITDNVRLINLVHDGSYFVVPANRLEENIRFLSDSFTRMVIDYCKNEFGFIVGMPLRVGVKIGRNMKDSVEYDYNSLINQNTFQKG